MVSPEFKAKASILDISTMGIKDKAVICESIGDILSPTADKLAKAGDVRDGGA